MEATRGCSGRLLLGLPVVVADPCHHRREVSTLGEDRGTLDDGPPRAMRARKAREQNTDVVVVHNLTIVLSYELPRSGDA
jgi:hypothetical protein